MINSKNNKKVLIFGHTFNNGSAGITIKSLFSNWDKDQLYCVSTKDIENHKHFNAYFLLGKEEVYSRFPFSLIYQTSNNHSVVLSRNVKNEKIKSSVNEKPSATRLIYEKYLNPLLKRLKVYHYRTRYRASEELKSWISSIDPDIIYAHIGNLEECIILNQVLVGNNKSRVVVHFFDDWISFMPSQVLFSTSYKRLLEQELTKLFTRSNVNLTISEPMAKEYKRRYGCDFKPFHNPVNAKVFESTVRFKSSRTSKIITYLGRVDKDNIDVINDVITAIDNLVAKGSRYTLNIYTNSNTKQSFVDSNIKRSENVKILPYVPHEEIANLLINCSDILLLPNSFKVESVEYVKYSISTKLTEYLASKTPLLVYAPKGICITDFCLENNCATTLSERNISLLERMIKDIDTSNPAIITKINNGRNLIMRKYTEEVVCSEFDRAINSPFDITI